LRIETQSNWRSKDCKVAPVSAGCGTGDLGSFYDDEFDCIFEPYG
jgi:hypothetical protein